MGIDTHYHREDDLGRLIDLREFSHSFTASLSRLGLLLLSLDTWLVIESPLFDFREKTFLGQFFLEISYGLFYLVVVHDNFHNKYPVVEKIKRHPALL